MTHQHHIMPRHLGGTNDPDNIIEVSVKEHAEIHRCLWIYGGRWQDYAAWKCLSGQVKGEDVFRMISSLANKKKNPAHSKRMKLLWQDPDFRSKYIGSRGPLSENHKAKLKGSERTKAQRKQAELASKRLQAAPPKQWTKGKCWYNNGVKSIMAYECPEGWKPGVIKKTCNSKNTLWWNKDGKRKRSKECPGLGWKEGMK